MINRRVMYALIYAFGKHSNENAFKKAVRYYSNKTMAHEDSQGFVRKSLIDSFDWSESPQGHVHWSNIYEKEVYFKLLHDKFYALFIKLRKIYDYTDSIFILGIFIKRLYEQLPDEQEIERLSKKPNTESFILAAFLWGETPEGTLFWADLLDKKQEFKAFESLKCKITL